MRVVQSAAVGGTASVIGGGKFANGAMTAAFVQAAGDAVAAKQATESPAGNIQTDKKGLDVDAARDLYNEQLAALRNEGIIPQRTFFERLFGTDKFSFVASYATLTDTQAVHHYPSLETAEAGEGAIVPGLTRGGASRIFMSAAYYSRIPDLGPGLVSPASTMRWVLLHEYGHQLYGGGREIHEVLADKFARENF